MQFTLSTILLGALASTATAIIAKGESWSGKNCNSGSSFIRTKDVDGFHCFAVGGNSIKGIQENGDCIVTTWSGGNCEGSSDDIYPNGCVNVPFGSWSITC